MSACTSFAAETKCKMDSHVLKDEKATRTINLVICLILVQRQSERGCKKILRVLKMERECTGPEKCSVCITNPSVLPGASTTTNVAASKAVLH